MKLMRSRFLQLHLLRFSFSSDPIRLFRFFWLRFSTTDGHQGAPYPQIKFLLSYVTISLNELRHQGGRDSELETLKKPGAAAAANSVSRVRLCATPQTAAHQAPLSPGFSRQEYWSGLPFPSPRSHGTNWQTKMPAKNNKALKTNVVVMSLLGKYPKELKIDPHASTIHAHLCSTFQKSQKVRTAQMFVKIWMHKQIVVYGRDAQTPGHVPILVCDCLQPSCT